jgi:hypothetical protein
VYNNDGSSCLIQSAALSESNEIEMFEKRS